MNVIDILVSKKMATWPAPHCFPTKVDISHPDDDEDDAQKDRK